MDVHDVEIRPGAGLERVLDIAERNPGGAAVKDGQLRIDLLDLFIGALQQRNIVRAARPVSPEAAAVLLVPDLPVPQVLRVTRHDPADVTAPRIGMPPGRSRPRNVVVENRQDADVRLFRERNELVEAAEIPGPLLRLDAVPVEVGADPVDVRLVHALEFLRRDIEFAAADMGADAVGIVRDRRSRREGETDRGECHAQCSFEVHKISLFAF